MFKRTDRFSFRKGSPKSKQITPSFILRFQKATDSPKYGVVVGKVVSKKAVLRNRAKRMFTQALQEVLLERDNSYDLVFFLRLPFQEYQKSSIIGDLTQTIDSINKI